MSSATAQLRPETRAEVTDRIAREIIEAETTARQKLTAELRSARLRKEAAERAAARRSAPAAAPARRRTAAR